MTTGGQNERESIRMSHRDDRHNRLRVDRVRSCVGRETGPAASAKADAEAPADNGNDAVPSPPRARSAAITGQLPLDAVARGASRLVRFRSLLSLEVQVYDHRARCSTYECVSATGHERMDRQSQAKSALGALVGHRGGSGRRGRRALPDFAIKRTTAKFC